MTTTGAVLIPPQNILAGSVLMSSSVPNPVVSPGIDPDPPAYAGATSYALGDEVRYNSRRYRSRVSANLGFAPDTAVDKWLDIGPINRHGMFDPSLGTSTSASEQIVVTIAPTAYVDALWFAGVDADTVRVQVASSPFDVTYQMWYPRAVTNMWEYRFQQFDRRDKLLVEGLPVGAGQQITVTLSKPGSVAKCAMLVAGFKQRIGISEFGISTSIKDFSVKTTDKWGAPTLLEGGFADRITVTVDLQNHMIDAVKRLLSKYRAVPVVWVLTGLFESTQVYGTFKDFSVVIPNAKRSKCQLELEGFTYG